MKSFLKKLFSLALALMLAGTGAGMAEVNPMYEKGGEEWYREVLARSLVSPGSNLRLKNVIARARAGEEITIAVIGGSITEGAGAARYQDCWASLTARRFGRLFGTNGGKNVKLVNAGVGGTPSTFGLMRYQRDVVERVTDPDGLPDIVIIEFSVNDWGEPTGHRCFEALVRTALAQPNDPAVILLFAVFKNGFNLQDELRRIGDAYGLPMVSIRDGVYPEVGVHLTAEEFFYDEYHPTSLGHAIMSDCLLRAIGAADDAEPSENDADISAGPVFGADWVGLRTVYAGRETEGVTVSRGGFAHDDHSSYTNTPVGRVCGENFFHSAGDPDDPLTVTGKFKKLLVAFKAARGSDWGRAEILVDGKVRAVVGGGNDKWGQSEVVLCLNEAVAEEHTVEIRMTEATKDKKFTITCLGIVP
ncbi:MAG: SGNH/GDSL hydrolase family protein [Clostridia bacterium]|nr:SGNH/GDSL hydrolase family protein [Clostridia bacterium]